MFLANNTELYLKDPVFDIAPTLDDYGSVMVNSGTAIEKITNEGNLNEVIVAVLDSGLAKEHPFFNYDRFLDDGSSLWGTSTDDGSGHGTHVSGIIYNNTPSCVKIRPYKVINDYNMGSLLSVALTVPEVVDKGADVINMSLGNLADAVTYLTFSDAISYAKEKNVPVVVASGNEYKELTGEIPATFTDCITVASVNDNGSPSEFANYGYAVDIAAPGEKINSTLPYKNRVKENGIPCNNHYYATVSGTSMATPFVTAAVAILLSIDNALSVSDVETILKQTTQIPDDWNVDYGAGIVDFLKMTTLRKTAAPKITLTDNGAVITASPQAKIYYTTDGTNPIVGESDLYLGEPIKTSRVEKIKAIAYIEEQLPSSVAVFDVYWTENIVIRYKGRHTVELDYEMERYNCTNEEMVSFDGKRIKGESIGKATVVIFYETGQRVIYNVTVKFADWQVIHKFFYKYFGILLWSF